MKHEGRGNGIRVHLVRCRANRAGVLLLAHDRGVSMHQEPLTDAQITGWTGCLGLLFLGALIWGTVWFCTSPLPSHIYCAMAYGDLEQCMWESGWNYIGKHDEYGNPLPGIKNWRKIPKEMLRERR